MNSKGPVWTHLKLVDLRGNFRNMQRRIVRNFTRTCVKQYETSPGGPIEMDKCKQNLVALLFTVHFSFCIICTNDRKFIQSNSGAVLKFIVLNLSPHPSTRDGYASIYFDFANSSKSVQSVELKRIGIIQWDNCCLALLYSSTQAYFGKK